MANQTIVDFIGRHSSSGQPEEKLREFLTGKGIGKSTVDDAFQAYYKSQTSQRNALKKPEKVYSYADVRRQRDKRQATWRWAKRGMMLTVLIGLVTAGYITFKHLTAKQAPAPTTIKLNRTEQQSRDVTLIGSALGQFAAVNNGNLPSAITAQPNGELKFCNSNCILTYNVSGMVTYPAANIHLTSYTVGLTVPNDTTMLLVPTGQCDQGQLSKPSTQKGAMAILYATTNGGTLTQHCIQP